MHPSSMDLMENMWKKYRKDEYKNVLDVGSLCVRAKKGQAKEPKIYKRFFEDLDYKGLDIKKGFNVDIVCEDPYVFPIEEESYDVVISGQAFEHIEFFWLTFDEMARVLKPGGLMILIAPSQGKYHAYPVDCWRFYKDSMPALAKWSGLELLECSVDSKCKHSHWADCCGVFTK